MSDQQHECLLMKVVLFECQLGDRVSIIREGPSWRLVADSIRIPICFCPYCAVKLALTIPFDEVLEVLGGKPTS